MMPEFRHYRSIKVKNRYLCGTVRAFSIIWHYKFLAVQIALFTKTLRFLLRYCGTVRANAFFRIDLFLDDRGAPRDREHDKNCNGKR